MKETSLTSTLENNILIFNFSRELIPDLELSKFYTSTSFKPLDLSQEFILEPNEIPRISWYSFSILEKKIR